MIRKFKLINFLNNFKIKKYLFLSNNLVLFISFTKYNFDMKIYILKKKDEKIYILKKKRLKNLIILSLESRNRFI